MDNTNYANNLVNNDSSSDNPKKKFYKRLWFMWLMLIFIPPVGIILLWRYSNYKKVVKVALSILFASITISACSGNNENMQTNNKETSSVTSVQKSKVQEVKSSANVQKKDDSSQKKAIVSGWQKIGDHYYYYDNAGKPKSGWIYDNGKKYYCDSLGKMRTGWINLNNQYYYCDENGVMKTGWIQDGSDWYYLDNNGVMETNREREGYRIDAKGRATKIEKNNTRNNNVKSNSSKSNNSYSSNTSSLNNFATAAEDNTTYEPAPTGRTVYWTPGGKSYHYNPDCPTLKRSKTVLSGSGSQCPKDDPCNVCCK